MRITAGILPSGMTVDDVREAYRALKGQVLRQEVYADDGTAAASHPYVVAENGYEVRRLQPTVRIPSKVLGAEAQVIHGAFFSHPRESLSYHYERNPVDPRITHAFTLEVDAFGTVRRSAAVGYPRRAARALRRSSTSRRESRSR